MNTQKIPSRPRFFLCRCGIARAQDALALIRQMPIQIVPADEQMIFTAAHIKANYVISYADAFVVAIAMQETAAILTGDPEFQSVEELIQVEWLQASTARLVNN